MRATRPTGPPALPSNARAAPRADAPATRADDRANDPVDRPARSQADRGTRPAGSRTSAADTADSERQAIAHRLHRALVDHAYGVARDAWAGAAPEGRRDILPALKRVESAEPGRRLAGLNHMLKGENRLKEKIADELAAPDVSVREALGKISDGVRYTFIYNPQRYADGTLADIERLKAEGFELMKLKNLWTDEQYKGRHSAHARSVAGLASPGSRPLPGEPGW